MTVPVGSVPDGGSVSVAVRLPVLMPEIVVYGPVKELLFVLVLGSRMITVLVESVPEGGSVTVVPTVPVLILVIVL